jgi:hypothetical protein
MATTSATMTSTGVTPPGRRSPRSRCGCFISLGASPHATRYRFSTRACPGGLTRRNARVCAGFSRRYADLLLAAGGRKRAAGRGRSTLSGRWRSMPQCARRAATHRWPPSAMRPPSRGAADRRRRGVPGLAAAPGSARVALAAGPGALRDRPAGGVPVARRRRSRARGLVRGRARRARSGCRWRRATSSAPPLPTQSQRHEAVCVARAPPVGVTEDGSAGAQSGASGAGSRIAWRSA